MSMQFETTTRNAWLDTITSKVGSNGRLKIYAGTIPANCGTGITSQTLLVDMPCSATFAAAASGGVLTVNAISQTNAAASGTASFFRVYESTSTTCYMQGTVTATGGGGDLQLNTVTIASGGPDTITSFTITAPGA